MKILIVSEKFWPEGGGGTLATYLITKLLSEENDMELTVITGTRRPAHIMNTKFIYDPILNVSNKAKLLLNFARPQVRQWYRKFIRSFDVIYTPYGYPVIPIAKELNKRVIAHVHDYQPVSYNSIILHRQNNSNILKKMSDEIRYEVFEYNDIKRAFFGSLFVPIDRLYRLWISKADTIICVSLSQAKIISNIAPELACKIKVIYNPPPRVPLIKKREPENPVFIYLGGDSYVKGFQVFLRASQRLIRKRPKVSFILAGNCKNASKRLIPKLGRIYKILGHVSHREVLKLYSSCLALIFPSICEEPLPYAVIESMLSGTIPVASKVGGIPEIVQGTYAEKILFEPENVSELSKKIEKILSLSREDLKNIGIGLREAIFKRFDTEKIKRKLLKIFN
ncbi:MAG: glycosyltransferase family 4 protein [Candidatus Baldrarchaeia archaeon]